MNRNGLEITGCFIVGTRCLEHTGRIAAVTARNLPRIVAYRDCLDKSIERRGMKARLVFDDWVKLMGIP
ncbi:MAG: hypothetical protein F4227_06145 [Gammaproteobacteria bacterium]|nr:hypothetical protein [Gammaproteobacteria bacterium]